MRGKVRKKLARAARARGIPTAGAWWRRFKEFHLARKRGEDPYAIPASRRAAPAADPPERGVEKRPAHAPHLTESQGRALQQTFRERLTG